MSVFLHFVFFDSIKLLKILLIVSRQCIWFTCPVSVSLYFDSRRIHEIHGFFPVNFLLQFITCSSLTRRSWLTEALRCIKDLVHSEFPISASPCCHVAPFWWWFHLISATVTGLRSLESDVFFYNSWPRKMQHFSPSAAFAI